MMNKKWSGVILFSILSVLVLISSLDTMALLEEPPGMTEEDCRNCHNGNLSFNGTIAERHQALNESQGYACEYCHEMVGNYTTPDYYPEEVIRDCLVCHVNKNHTDVHLLVAQSGSYNCMDCHPLVWDEVNQRFNPEVIGDCTVCHGYAKNGSAIIANAGGPYVQEEGSLITFDASSSSHPKGDWLRYRWDFASDGTWDTPLSSNPTKNHLFTDDFTGNVTVKVRVGMKNDTATAPVTITNVPPVVKITSSYDSVYPTGRTLTFTGTYFDPGADTHDVQWTFESVTAPITVTNAPSNVDGRSFSHGHGRARGRPGTYSNPGTDSGTARWTFESDTAPVPSVSDGSVSTNYTFTDAGLYTVELTVTDDDGGVGTATNGDAYIVIYNPNSGLVTGKGWIYSPPEACPVLCEGRSGKAQFSFTSNYKKGMAVPTGEAQFKFQAGGLNFNSNGYEWMVVSGARVILKGTGTMNGAGGYTFMLKAIDANKNTEDNYTVDRFGIRIWEDVGGEELIVYDNLQSDDEEEATIEIGGGSIVIHSK